MGNMAQYGVHTYTKVSFSVISMEINLPATQQKGVSSQDLIQEVLCPAFQAASKHGITLDSLMEHQKRLLTSKKPVVQKVQGDVDPETLPENANIVGKSAFIIKDDDGNEKAQLVKETIIQLLYDDGPLQQRAIENCLKLLAAYPNEKVDHNVTGGLMSIDLTPASEPERKAIDHMATSFVKSMVTAQRKAKAIDV